MSKVANESNNYVENLQDPLPGSIAEAALAVPSRDVFGVKSDALEVVAAVV